jgi:prepilin-type N-terminal cleavage/methylation domain-containing protein
VGPRRQHGFTLIELMVTLAIISLAMSLVFGLGSGILPQTRLAATADELADRLRTMRAQAILERRTLVFVYDIEHQGYSAYTPVELDDQGRVLGPGRTDELEFTPLREGMVFERIQLADGTSREDGQIELPISPLGRMPPHDVIIVNPDRPDFEVRTIRVSGLTMDSTVYEQRLQPEVVEDASFR